MKKYIHAKINELTYHKRNLFLMIRAFRSSKKKLYYPPYIQLQTINRCNGLCIMCPYHKTVAKEDLLQMPFSSYQKLIDNITLWPNANKLGGVLIFNFQNEPFLDSRLEEFIKYARTNLPSSFQLEITTNGTTLNQERINTLKKSPPDILQISLNAHDKDTYKNIMNIDSYDLVVSNIHQLIGQLKTTKIFIRFIKQNNNIAEYKSFKRYWNKMGASVMAFELNDRNGSVDNYDLLKIHKKGLITRFFKDILKLRVFPHCPLIFIQANISASMDVIMCCNDYEKKTLMGNLKTDNLINIFNNKRWNAFRKMARKKKYPAFCAGCSVLNDSIWVQGEINCENITDSTRC